jgi:hypothetical protein
MKRALAVVAWMAFVGTMAGTRHLSGDERVVQQSQECIEINGVIYCPCDDSRRSCEPPDCVLIGGEWYCSAG